MKVIGLTGPSGRQGHSRAFTQKHGIPAIDTDRLYRKILIPPSPCLDDLKATFGDSIIRPDGTLDRKALAAIVFSDKAKLSLLNSVTHKYILARVKKRIAYRARRGERAVIVDAPALFESGFDAKCDITITITAGRSRELRASCSATGLTAPLPSGG